MPIFLVNVLLRDVKKHLTPRKRGDGRCAAGGWVPYSCLCKGASAAAGLEVKGRYEAKLWTGKPPKHAGGPCVQQRAERRAELSCLHMGVSRLCSASRRGKTRLLSPESSHVLLHGSHQQFVAPAHLQSSAGWSLAPSLSWPDSVLSRASMTQKLILQN